MIRRVNVYEAFIDGAKEGFAVVIKIIPYLVAILVAIGVFRASGAMDYLVAAIGKGVSAMGLNTDFIAALPTALMKPLSGSGARGMMVDAMKTYGADSFVGRLASTLPGRHGHDVLHHRALLRVRGGEEDPLRGGRAG